MFKLKKHQKKVDKYKDEYLEEYYSSIRDLKRKNAEYNKYEVFGIAA